MKYIKITAAVIIRLLLATYTIPLYVFGFLIGIIFGLLVPAINGILCGKKIAVQLMLNLNEECTNQIGN